MYDLQHLDIYKISEPNDVFRVSNYAHQFRVKIIEFVGIGCTSTFSPLTGPRGRLGVCWKSQTFMVTARGVCGMSPDEAGVAKEYCTCSNRPSKLREDSMVMVNDWEEPTLHLTCKNILAYVPNMI